MRIKITWSNGNVEFCTAYGSIEKLARDYFGLGGRVPEGIKVEDVDAKPEPVVVPEPVVEPVAVPAKPATKAKKSK